jgi:hypothetical protein
VHPYIRDLIDLDLPLGDYALFGSGPLLLRGWIDEVGDLDVLSRGPVWEQVVDLGVMTLLPDGNEIVEVGEGITIGHTWPYGEASIDEMIDSAEMIQNVPCVRLEHIVAYKRAFDRPKDRAHLAVIAELSR